MILSKLWQHNKNVGTKGECLVARYVKKTLKLRVIERNWRETKSELDIIAISRKRKELHIIEVKSRTNTDWEGVARSLSYQKVSALRRGAIEFVQLNDKYKSYTLMFDVAVVFFGKEKESKDIEIKYIENIRF